MRIQRISVAQSNFMVGAIEANRNIIIEGIRKAEEAESDIIVFPELAIPGYPPEDLVFKPDFIASNLKALDEIVLYTKGKEILVIVGFINRTNDITNSVAVIYNGEIKDIYDKIYLPNYGVFDEKRYFKAGESIPVYLHNGIRLGVNICEDIWYPLGPGHYQTAYGNAEVIINISASPFHRGKQDYREKMYAARSGDESAYLINVNMAGGQDELVFDGTSTAYDYNGNLFMRMKSFEEDFQTFDINVDGVFRERLKDIRRRQLHKDSEIPFALKEIIINDNPAGRQVKIEKTALTENKLNDLESTYQALVVGTRNYVNKNGFKNVIIAVSGGIDSALVAAIAVDALGPERVKGIYLPSQFSADISGEDARKLADNLGFKLLELPIKEIFEHYNDLMEPIFRGLPFGVAEENLQSRIRGNIVMAISNKFGWMVLTTGNKSEMSTGYATLYGDMAGGFAVIKDVLKSLVFDLSRFINREKEIIPTRIIERPPSAELRPDQKDTDSLPPYEILDAIIKAYVEDDKTIDEIINEIGDESTVRKYIGLIDRNEYKRRQSPPGVKVTPRAFGRDRRMPITNGYRG